MQIFSSDIISMIKQQSQFCIYKPDFSPAAAGSKLTICVLSDPDTLKIRSYASRLSKKWRMTISWEMFNKSICNMICMQHSLLRTAQFILCQHTCRQDVKKLLWKKKCIGKKLTFIHYYRYSSKSRDMITDENCYF